MAITWAKEDDIQMEAAKFLEQQGKGIHLVHQDAKHVMLEFDVIDSTKANMFLSDLLYNDDLQSVTGIKINSIGYPQRATADQIREHVSAINELLLSFASNDGGN